MGDPKKGRKKYSRPRKSFQKERMVKEKALKELYGLKNKKEFYMAESTIRAKRATTRKLLALDLERRLKQEQELLNSLKRIGLLQNNPTLDDILTLSVESLLERRLQTIVWRKGLANTPKQARQFITHGHIAINNKKVSIPSYIVSMDEEKQINYYGKEMVIDGKKQVKMSVVEKKDSLKKQFEEVNVTEENVEKKVNSEIKKGNKESTEKNEVEKVSE